MYCWLCLTRCIRITKRRITGIWMTLLGAVIVNPVKTHHFWPDNVSLRDSNLFTPSVIAGPKQITDIYLLGLCNYKMAQPEPKVARDGLKPVAEKARLRSI